MSRSAVASCVLGHRRKFRGWWIDRRVDRWFAKHEHPDAG